MSASVDLMVPVKALRLAKTRLRGGRDGADPAHHRLVLAVTRDTVAAAGAARLVRRVVAVCSDPAVVAVLRADGVTVLPDEPDAGLNAALRYGAGLLRAEDPGASVGALQADLPALRPAELDAALAAAAAVFAGGPAITRAFRADRPGTGTTLLLAAPGAELDPRFGAGSAAAHAGSGAWPLTGPWPGLSCDVDTAADLAVAVGLGVGRHTTAALATGERADTGS